MPTGYQTNLPIMGPGHSRLRNSLTVVLPLVFIVGAAFSLSVRWSYGLP
jgi:hypothetical protein